MSRDSTPAGNGPTAEVFAAFLKLGLTSFGGPIAHLGYFRDEFVVRRRWVDDKTYAEIVALCQFLPGPASSQVGFALGLLRAGPLGSLAAWAAFTLPSAIFLVLFAYGAALYDGPVAAGIVSGLKIVAVAIVAQAVWGMARSFCPDGVRSGIALAAALAAVLAPGAGGQVAAILIGALAGLAFVRETGEPGQGRIGFAVPKAVGAACLGLFFLLLAGLPLVAFAAQGLAVFDSFYRAGALVFGGGHVVLPLLEAETVAAGWVDRDSFLAGYGAAQAVPGPLFTFAAYLGAVLGPAPNGVAGAALALVAIFLPGFLLLVGVIPFWDALRRKPAAQAALLGTNAAVVGILGAALYDPVFTGAVTGPHQFALALACFVLIAVWKAPPWSGVLLAAAGGALIGVL